MRGALGLVGFVLAAFVIFRGVFAVIDVLDARDDDVVVVGSKAFSESYILAEAFAQLIEQRTDLRVERRINLGSTQICQAALQNGAIDLYPEYTGTGLMAILQEPRQSDPQQVLARVRKVFGARWSLVWLDPLAFSNTYAMAMTQRRAEALGIRRVSDLRDHPGLVLGAPPEFLDRTDGFPGLQTHYGGPFVAAPRAMEAGLMYQAVADGSVDVISAYSTDARIDKFDLFLLEDDREFFPPYQAAPLVRRETLARHPEIRGALAPLAGRIDAATMRRLNGLVDIDGRSPAEVAALLIAGL
jgi:glycine betaine/choline ABC-type transport system substrate-binding protein